MRFDACRLHRLLLAAVLALQACSSQQPFSNEQMSAQEKAALFMNMGRGYMDMGRLELAKDKLETAVRLDSSSAEVNNAMGEFYEHIREYDTAKGWYATAVKKDPNNYGVKSNFGRFLCDHEDYQGGLELLQQALSQPMNNRQWYAMTGIGLCYAKQGDMEHAEEYLRQALLIQPDFPVALAEMMKLSYQKRQYLSARAFLERYLGVAKHTPETLWYAFQTERALGNDALADDYGEQLFNSFPLSKEAQDVKGVLHR